METIMGECRFCGRQMGVIAETKAEADRIVMNECSCPQSKIERKKEALRGQLEKLIGEKSEELGFEPVDEAVRAEIEAIGGLIVNGAIRSANFRVDGTVISIKNNKKIKITRTYTYEQSEEIEE